MRWVGIDEAGYAPNLGPLVMTAVVAEGPGERAPDLWADLASSVARAGGDPESLWVDDSKRIFRGRKGFERLEAGSLTALAATGRGQPSTLAGLLQALDAGTADDVELTLWLDGAADRPIPSPESQPLLERALSRKQLDGAPWRLCAIRTVVVGPARFNDETDAGGSKANAHFWAFSRLLKSLWDQAEDGTTTRIRSDKHGGRNAYMELLYRVLPDTWIDRGEENALASCYSVRDSRRRLELLFQPRADSADGLVALASMVSKLVRERWMEVFNAFWAARIPGLRPTAGYPADASRFRAVIEPECVARGLDPRVWWRTR
jgi:ribonuclease HII